MAGKSLLPLLAGPSVASEPKLELLLLAILAFAVLDTLEENVRRV